MGRQLKFMCCLCGEECEAENQLILAQGVVDGEQPHEQTWFVHVEPCFKEALHERVRSSLYLLEHS